MQIDCDRPMKTAYKEVFDDLSDEFLEYASNAFPQVLLEHDIWAHPQTCRFLEEMFAMEVTGLTIPSMLEVDAWINKHGHQVCKRLGILPNVVVIDYVKEQVSTYHAASYRLRQSLGGKRIALHKKQVHPMLGIEFSGLLEIDDTIFVSIHESVRSQYAYMHHRIASCFDTRKRVLVHEYVYKTSETPMEMAPSRNPTTIGKNLWDFARQLAQTANIKIGNMFCVFDLEWNNQDPKTRFTEGDIVDAHFQELHAGWIMHTGTIKPPAAMGDLTPFLQDHGYTTDILQGSADSIDTLRRKLQVLMACSDRCIFSAYSGVNSDILVLQSYDIFLDNYIDAMILLTGGRSMSLVKLHAMVFGTTFDAHSAWADTTALINLMRTRTVTYVKAASLLDTLKTMQV